MRLMNVRYMLLGDTEVNIIMSTFHKIGIPIALRKVGLDIHESSVPSAARRETFCSIFVRNVFSYDVEYAC